MRVLFDNGTPRGVAAALGEHTVEEARERGWDTLRNGGGPNAGLDAPAPDTLPQVRRDVEVQRNCSATRGSNGATPAAWAPRWCGVTTSTSLCNSRPSVTYSILKSGTGRVSERVS